MPAALAVPGDADFYLFDAPEGAQASGLFEGYACEVYLPDAAGSVPMLTLGTIVYSDVYGPWRAVRCLAPQPSAGALVYGCVRAAWNDGAGSVAFSECVTKEDYPVIEALP